MVHIALNLEFSAKMSLRNSFKLCNNKNNEGNVCIDFARTCFCFYPFAYHVVAKQVKISSHIRLWQKHLGLDKNNCFHHVKLAIRQQKV